jgi:hypothetical protein
MEWKLMWKKSDENFKTTVSSKTYRKTIYNWRVCLGSMLTKDGRRTCEIKSRIAMAKAAFNKKRALFTSKMD